jgi:hypothetical protein
MTIRCAPERWIDWTIHAAVRILQFSITNTWNFIRMAAIEIFSGDLRRRNQGRLNYMREVLEPLLAENAEQFYEEASARVLLASNDVFGPGSSVVDALCSVRTQGLADDNRLSESIAFDQVNLIEPEKAVRLAQLLAYELLCIHNRHLDYFLEEGLMGLWSALETSGMSHADIGRYFERYNNQI